MRKINKIHLQFSKDETTNIRTSSYLNTSRISYQCYSLLWQNWNQRCEDDIMKYESAYMLSKAVYNCGNFHTHGVNSSDSNTIQNSKPTYVHSCEKSDTIGVKTTNPRTKVQTAYSEKFTVVEKFPLVVWSRQTPIRCRIQTRAVHCCEQTHTCGVK